MSENAFFGSLRDYYADRLTRHGPSALGVDWNSTESQVARFAPLLRVVDRPGRYRLGDYGCGYGALYDHLVASGTDCDYSGYDITPEMIESAKRRHRDDPRATFSTAEGDLAGSDYIVASGVFNLKMGMEGEEWERYLYQAIGRLDALSGRGFAFNCLTSYSDPDKMRPDLYYADPRVLFDHCKRRYSRQVALLHDYGVYEFTIIVRK